MLPRLFATASRVRRLPCAQRAISYSRPQSAHQRGNRVPPSRSPAVSAPLANAALVAAHPRLRLVGADGKSIGEVLSRDALDRAVGEGLDLVLVSPGSGDALPVARFLQLSAVVAHVARASEESAKRASVSSKAKELRLSARTDAHDLATKAARGIGFLREGKPLRLLVSFTQSAWMKEEPARREVFAAFVRRIAESGAGFCDAGSIAGAGPALSGLFSPTNTPRGADDWARTLTRLSEPIRPHGAGESEPSFRPAAAAAAIAMPLTPPPFDTLLPPADILLGRLPKGGKGGGAKGGKDNALDDDSDGDDDGFIKPAGLRKALVLGSPPFEEDGGDPEAVLGPDDDDDERGRRSGGGGKPRPQRGGFAKKSALVKGGPQQRGARR